MQERIRYTSTELNHAGDDAVAAFGRLTAGQLNWRPVENSWSVAQCLDHLIRTNHEFDAEFERLASGTRKNSLWERISPFTGLGGRFLIKELTEDSKKTKAPSPKLVPPSDIDADIVEQFREDIRRVAKQVEACGGVDLAKTVVTSPFLKLLTYRLDDAFTVIVEHTKRHIRQAKRVMQNENFPGGDGV